MATERTEILGRLPNLRLYAIGYFHRNARKYYDDDGEHIERSFNAGFMDGKDVEVLRVTDGESGHFDAIVVTDEDGMTESEVKA